jgi:hypothetical protein
MVQKSFWRVALTAGLLLGMPATGQALEESNSVWPGYYDLPGISQLSNNGDGWDVSDEILAEDSNIDFGGWVQFGYTSNSTGLFNSNGRKNNQELNGFNNHQTWLYLEKSLDTEGGFDWGGRFDAMYGIDAGDTQSFGNSTDKWDFENGFDHGIYGFAFPQLYLELGYEDFSIKGGHFYTLVGYEVVTAPDNFFFSHAFTMYNSEPFTHTGFVATYSGFDKIELYGGWTAGWDTGFDRKDEGSSFLGGASISPIDEVTFIYIATAGDFGAIGTGYSHSIVVDTTPLARFDFMSDLNYVIQSDVLTTNNSVGINQYLFYPLFDEIGLGVRGEWWRTEKENYGGLTGGVNIALLPNLMVRPEGRYQWGPSGDDNVAGLPHGKGIFGIDMILTF